MQLSFLVGGRIHGGHVTDCRLLLIVVSDLSMKTGKATFLVKLHFKDDGSETLKNKVKDLIRKDVENGNF